MSIQYVANSLRAITIPGRLRQRIFLTLSLWADNPPLDGVRVTYRITGTHAGTYRIAEGQERMERVTGTQASPEAFRHWIVIDGPEPPPARVDLEAVIRHGGVTRRGGTALLLA